MKNDFTVRLARSNEYKQFKNVLNKGKYPTFIGRGTFARCAHNGGALFYVIDDELAGVSLINPHYGVLLVLNVIPKYRHCGLGRAIMDYLMPNYAHVIDYKVAWFESIGYTKIGTPKKGLKYKTQLMVRTKLLRLAGNVKKAFIDLEKS